jgi:adenylate cyclase
MKEIERKFLVDPDKLPKMHNGIKIMQGYLAESPTKTLARVRIYGDKGFLTIKGKNKGMTRPEFEYEIPLEDAVELMKLTDKIVEKTRYRLGVKGKIWEIDFFQGNNEGLILAEVELASEKEVVEIPCFATEEVTEDPKYYNSNLV